MRGFIRDHSLSITFGIATVAAQISWVIGHKKGWHHNPESVVELVIVGYGHWGPELGTMLAIIIASKYLREIGSAESKD